MKQDLTLHSFQEIAHTRELWYELVSLLFLCFVFSVTVVPLLSPSGGGGGVIKFQAFQRGEGRGRRNLNRGRGLIKLFEVNVLCLPFVLAC